MKNNLQQIKTRIDILINQILSTELLTIHMKIFIQLIVVNNG